MKATAASCLTNLFPNWHEKKYWKELSPKNKTKQNKIIEKYTTL